MGCASRVWLVIVIDAATHPPRPVGGTSAETVGPRGAPADRPFELTFYQKQDVLINSLWRPAVRLERARPPR